MLKFKFNDCVVVSLTAIGKLRIVGKFKLFNDCGKIVVPGLLKFGNIICDVVEFVVVSELIAVNWFKKNFCNFKFSLAIFWIESQMLLFEFSDVVKFFDNDVFKQQFEVENFNGVLIRKRFADDGDKLKLS